MEPRRDVDGHEMSLGLNDICTQQMHARLVIESTGRGEICKRTAGGAWKTPFANVSLRYVMSVAFDGDEAVPSQQISEVRKLAESGRRIRVKASRFFLTNSPTATISLLMVE